MRVVIDKVEIQSIKDGIDLWLIQEREILEEGDVLGEYRMLDTKTNRIQSFDEEVGHERLHLHQMPANLVLFRAAEYNISPDDINTLLDIAVCERFIPREWWEGDDHLFAAGDIETARIGYLAKIAEVKLKHRISTRPKRITYANPDGSRFTDTLDALGEFRKAHTWRPADLALKSMQVILHRHRQGVQELDPAVAQALIYMEKAVAVHEDTDNTVSSEGYTR